MTSVANTRSRVVVTGVDSAGESCVLSDGPAVSRSAGPISTLTNLWECVRLPQPVGELPRFGEPFSLLPRSGGIKVLTAVLPPDDELARDPGAHARAFEINGIGEAHREDGRAAGFHQTDTVDVITVISGEIVAVLDRDEILLRPGDTLIQRGTRHAWSNRSTEPATFVLTMISGYRSEPSPSGP
jgi:mannose-6-phosphate isomerase-like protein (cupin superfamily)